MKRLSTEIRQSAGQRQNAQQPALVEIVKNGRIARYVEDLDDETIQAIANAEMSPKHDHLNNLLDE